MALRSRCSSKGRAVRSKSAAFTACSWPFCWWPAWRLSYRSARPWSSPTIWLCVSASFSRRIAERGAALRAGLDTAGNTALAKLERRKHENPSAVIALEALSQVLPDHTYITELRIEGRKLQIIGITRDAPALIGLIEQTSHFTRATFFAPTTRSPSDPGERFHIEARIEPVYTPRT